MRRSAWILTLGLLAGPTGRADAGPPVAPATCTEAAGEAAEEALGAAIDRLKAKPPARGAFASLLTALLNYAACDEADLAPLFSEAVCRQLADGWAEAPEIVRAARREAQVGRLLLRHLDEECPAESLRRIAASAKGRCPRYGAALCGQIQARAEQVLREARQRAGGE